MNLREFIVLQAMNIATTDHGRRYPTADGGSYWEFEATAKQIAECINHDEWFRKHFGEHEMNSRQVGAILGALNRVYPNRNYLARPLVRRVSQSRKTWQLTNAGVKVIGV